MRTADDLLSRKEAINAHRERLEYAITYRHEAPSFSIAQRAIQNISEETIGMARKIREEKGKKSEKVEFRGFANVELSNETKLEAKEWMRNLEDVQVEIDDFFAKQYKIGIMKSEQTGGYQATAFCQNADEPNAGYILSAYAPTWYDALCLLTYKHAIYCEGVWPVGEISKDIWG